MITFNNINPDKLLTEFNENHIKTKNGITSDLQIPDYIAKNAWCEFEVGTDMNIVQQIVDAHDPTPLPSPLSIEEQLTEKDRQIQALKEQQARIDSDLAEFMDYVLTGGV